MTFFYSLEWSSLVLALILYKSILIFFHTFSYSKIRTFILINVSLFTQTDILNINCFINTALLIFINKRAGWPILRAMLKRVWTLGGWCQTAM